MAQQKIGDLTLAASALDSDFIEFEIASNGLSRRITKANFIGATLTGGGIIATGGYTLSVPADGTASLLGVAQTYSAAKTFSSVIAANAGINFGQSTLNYYEENNWSPTLKFGGASVGMTLEAVGRYTRKGNEVTAWGRIRVTALGSSTGNASIGNLPYVSSNITSPNTLYYPVSFYVENVSFSGFLQGAVIQNSNSFLLVQNVNGTITVLTHTAFSVNDSLYFSVTYRTGS